MNYFKEDIESKFPSEENARQYVEHLSALDLSNIGDNELETLLDSMFPNFVYNHIYVDAGKLIYRAQLQPSPIKSISRISIAPEKYVKEYGRANRPKESLFYGANNFDLAAFEVCQWYKNRPGANHVGEVTVGIWRVKKQLHLASIVSSSAVNEKREDISVANERLMHQLENKSLPLRAKIASKIFLAFMSDQFAKMNINKHEEYKISALYTRRLYKMNEMIADKYSNLRFDGVMYPSVSMKYRGDNIALFKDAFVEKVEQVPVKAFFAMYGNLDFDQPRFTPGILHESDRFDGDEIIWKTEIYRSETKS